MTAALERSSNMVLKLAPDLELPDEEASTEVYAFLGMRKSGKTYAAGVMVERLMQADVPVIIFESVGNWYGLGISADGKGPGLPIHVFGGKHGQFELDPVNNIEQQASGLANVIIERNISAVIDTSLFSVNKRNHFVAIFCETLRLAAMEDIRPRMLVWEEAQNYSPQKMDGAVARMAAAVEQLIRLGRNWGFGSIIISQRPQSVNKETLNQAEMLFLGKMGGAQDRKAISAWVVEKDDGSDRKWVNELASRPKGELIAYSPSWLGIFQSVRFFPKITADTSATPSGKGKGTAASQRKPLAPVDVEGVKSALLKFVPQPKPAVKLDPLAKTYNADPKLLEEIKSLKVENSRLRRCLETTEINLKRNDAIADKLIEIANELQATGKVHRTSLETFTRPESEADARRAWKSLPESARGEDYIVPRGPTGKAQALVDAHRAKRHAERLNTGEHNLKPGGFRMLAALGAFHPGCMTAAQIARAGDMAIKGGSFAVEWKKLTKEHELIAEVAPDQYQVTEAGMAALGKDFEALPHTPEARIEFWQKRLKPTEGRMLSALFADRRINMPIETLAEKVEMAASGGGFQGCLGTLVRNKLVLKADGMVRLHPWLLSG
jgi:uncharacterized protein